MMKGNNGRTIWCQAKTWRQLNKKPDDPSLGCMKPAMGVTADGHCACRIHLERPPKGWNPHYEY